MQLGGRRKVVFVKVRHIEISLSKLVVSIVGVVCLVRSLTEWYIYVYVRICWEPK